MRIAYLVTTNTYSGAENMTLLIAKEMAKRKHIVWYCSPAGLITNYTTQKGVEHIEIDSVSIKTVRHISKSLRVDLFHACDNRASFVCALSGVPFIAHLHSNPLWLKKVHPYSLVMLFFCLVSRRTICVSDSVLNEYRFSFFIRSKCITLPNVVDLSNIVAEAKEKETTKYDVGFIGRFSREKDPVGFVSIMAEICRQRPGTTAVMIGDGELWGTVQEKIEELRLQNAVELKGFLKNPFLTLSKVQLVLMPSKWEGLPLTALESFALGKPVLATPVGGLPSIVNSSCGKLCNTEQEFVDEAILLLNNPALLQEKSKMATRMAASFGDIDSYMEKIEAICLETIKT